MIVDVFFYETSIFHDYTPTVLKWGASANSKKNEHVDLQDLQNTTVSFVVWIHADQITLLVEFVHLGFDVLE